MNLNPLSRGAHIRALALSISAALSLTAAGTSHAATPATAKAPETKPAKQCMSDLSAFQSVMQKGGYWLGSSSYGYGYPVYGYGYEGGMSAPMINSASMPAAGGYMTARPGYEVRTLLSAARILAQRGQQASCEALLGETRDIYTRYATALNSDRVPRDDSAGWRQAQLAGAQPVTGQDISYRSDQLIGTEVLSPKGETLGSIDDLVLSPKTGKIAYLVVGRGGLFGIDEKYVPVPWADFKTTAGAKLLELDSTKIDMAAAPHVTKNQVFTSSEFDAQSQKVDAFWTAHLVK